jgi:hypothetical protein
MGSKIIELATGADHGEARSRLVAFRACHGHPTPPAWRGLATACPDDNLLAAFVEGALETDAQTSSIEEHLDVCARCREIASAITAVRAPSGVRSRGVEPESGEEDIGPIGRFVVMGTLGRGGMGVVYRAYDPALDRDVALKLLRTDAGARLGEAAGARLEREAKAMALRHPT